MFGIKLGWLKTIRQRYLQLGGIPDTINPDTFVKKKIFRHHLQFTGQSFSYRERCYLRKLYQRQHTKSHRTEN